MLPLTQLNRRDLQLAKTRLRAVHRVQTRIQVAAGLRAAVWIAPRVRMLSGLLWCDDPSRAAPRIPFGGESGPDATASVRVSLRRASEFAALASFGGSRPIDTVPY